MPAADAEPGKILHEVRRGEMAELGEVPFRRYYGSVDSTPLFVMLAGAYFDRTADLVDAPAAVAAYPGGARWLDIYGDRDGDGFVEYFRMTGGVWPTRAGRTATIRCSTPTARLAEGPIALVEVQGYAYAARIAAARIARALGEAGRATALDGPGRAAAGAHRSGVLVRGYRHLCAGARRRRSGRAGCAASNAGHLLLCGVPIRRAGGRGWRRR